MNKIDNTRKKISIFIFLIMMPALGFSKHNSASEACTSCAIQNISQLTFRQVRVNDIEINYTELGQGQPIIFIHGWSSNSAYWFDQLKHFSKSYRAIAYDWRGMGESSGGDKPYEFDQLIEDLKVFIDTLGLDKPIIVGHSQGGVTALYFAAKYPNIPSAIISADAPGEENLVTSRFMYWLLNGSTTMTSFLDEETALSIQIPFNAYFFYSSQFKESKPLKLERWKRQFITNSSISLVNAMRALAYRTHLTKVTSGVPTLLVLGSEDKFINLDQTQAYRTFFKGSKIEVLPGAGHMSTEEQPENFNRVTEEFISQDLLNQSL